MGKGDRGAVVYELGRLLAEGVDPPRDGDLVERFRSGKDEAAFEALVTRHGPMVRGVCRRHLRDAHDVDDAFQATFLVLARKGAGLRDPDRVGPWLYGVASRVAAQARLRSARRRSRPLAHDLPARDDRGEWSDVAPILDAELARLPAIQRDVLVLCLMGGASEQEAARSLDCPVGTVKSRLSRAREALRGRLVKRGLAPAAALAAASGESFASPASMNLIHATLAAVAAKAAVPAAVAELTQGAALTMSIRSITAGLTLAGAIACVTVATIAQPAPPPGQALATPPPPERPPGQVAVTENHIREILIALHNYNDVYAAFPKPAITDGDGMALLSWRVAILPYIDQNDLYKEFHLDEPWNSPHNQSLLARMPATFETPDNPAPSGTTRLLAFCGPGAMFDQPFSRQAGRGVKPEEARDGTWNTAVMTVAETPIPWTRPDDLYVDARAIIPVDVQSLLPQIDAGRPKGILLGMADGATLYVPSKPSPFATLSALITRAAGDVIPIAPAQAGKLAPAAVEVPTTPATPPAPTPAGTTAPAPAATPEEAGLGYLKDDPILRVSLDFRLKAVEVRLQRLEAKVDTILERLAEPTLPTARPGEIPPARRNLGLPPGQ